MITCKIWNFLFFSPQRNCINSLKEITSIIYSTSKKIGNIYYQLKRIIQVFGLHAKKSRKSRTFPTKIFSDKLLLREFRLQELSVETGDVVDGDSLRALHLAGARVGTVTETKFLHLRNHIPSPTSGLRLTLRKQSEGADPCGHEQHCGTVLTGRHAGAATNAGSRVHALLSILVRDKDVVGILSGTSSDRDESASLKDLVKGAAVNHQVLDDRETGASERLYRDGGSVLEMTHEQLAGRHVIVRTVGTAIYEQ